MPARQRLRRGYLGPIVAALRLVRRSFVLDRAQLNPRDAIPPALGVLLPLAAGLALHRTDVGVAASAGALSVGFAALQGYYRRRTAIVLLTSVAMALSTFVGVATGLLRPEFPVLLAAWGFVAGLLIAVGPGATTFGLQAVVALLVGAGFPGSLHAALGRAALVLAGGLSQALLVLLAWPVRRFPIERAKTAAAYRSLAKYAAEIPNRSRAVPDPVTLPAARATLADPYPLARDADVSLFRALVEDGDRIRLSLAGLAEARAWLVDAPRRRPAVAELDDFVCATARALEQLAAAIATNTAPDVDLPRLDGLRAVTDRAGLAVGHVGASLVAELAPRAERLRELLESATRAAARLDSPRRLPLARSRERAGGDRARGEPVWRGDALTTLRANLSVRSAVFRHAVRLGVALVVAALIARRLPFSHRYWLPLTTLVVLRPDFSATVTRGVGRITGTLLGAGVATAVVAWWRPAPVQLAALIVVLAWLGYSTTRANYALFGVFVTTFVVLLLSLAGLPEPQAVGQRLLSTAAGGVLALVLYALWPTWEAAYLPAQVAELLRAQRGYVVAVLRSYADAESRDWAELRGLRDQARLARSNMEASVDRVLAEPARFARPIPPDVAADLLGQARAIALAGLALHAHLPQARAWPLSELLAFADALDTELAELAMAVERVELPAAIDGAGSPSDEGESGAIPHRGVLGPAREALVAALAAQLATIPDTAPEVAARQLDAALLDVESGALVEAVSQVAELLSAARRAGVRNSQQVHSG